MGFIDSYKKLEKLCSERYDTNHGLSSYIDEMAATADGSLRVPEWDEDLKQLKHYRWIRNKIAHEPDCSEKTMCSPCDAKWLDGFHARILAGKDPLTLYHKTTRRSTPKKAKKTQSAEHKGWLTHAMATMIILAAIALVVTVIVTLYGK